jgi:hypothetical protein
MIQVKFLKALISLILLAIIANSAPMSAYAHTIQLANATILAATDVVAEPLLDWIVPASTSEPLKANYDVPLKNHTERACLVYKERPFGINLGWSSACKPNISFVRQSGTWDAVHYGERIAIHVDGHGYLRYKERTFGINLVWSDKPVFEWEIHGGRDVHDGDVVWKNTPFAIYNHVEHDHVIYCERTFGINLRWARDCRHIGDTASHEYHFTVYLQPQPIYQGNIPYVARFPAFGDSNGTLKAVSLPEQYYGELVVRFVKPGRSTAECTDPTAVVDLREGKSLSAQDMQTLFGAATPGLPVVFVACVGKSPFGSVTPVLLNVTWTS